MVDRSKQFTKKTWKDPTRTLSRIARIEAKLTRLFRNYKKRVLAELAPARKTLPEIEQIAQKDPAWHEGVSINHFYNRLEDLTTEELIGPANAIIEKELPDSYTHGTKWADINIAATLGIRLGAPLEERQSRWKKVGALVEGGKSDFKGVSDEVNKRIRKIVADGIISEDTFGNVQREIVKAVDGVGINRAAMIGRTETMKAVNEGARDRYGKIGVDRLERIEAEDERTCTDHLFEIGDRVYHGCSEIDGQIFTLAEAAEVDAQTHPGCRGSWIISDASLGLTDESEEEATQKQGVPEQIHGRGLI